MKKLVTTTLIAAIAATGITASAIAGPFGGPGGFAPGGVGPLPPIGPGDFAPGGGGGPKPPKPPKGGGGHHHGKGNDFDALGAGLIGFGLGAVVGSMSQPQPQPQVHYQPDPHAMCAQRYKSYDPYSRTFMGFDGIRRLCPYWTY